MGWTCLTLPPWQRTLERVLFEHMGVAATSARTVGASTLRRRPPTPQLLKQGQLTERRDPGVSQVGPEYLTLQDLFCHILLFRFY